MISLYPNKIKKLIAELQQEDHYVPSLYAKNFIGSLMEYSQVHANYSAPVVKFLLHHNYVTYHLLPGKRYGKCIPTYKWLWKVYVIKNGYEIL